ncbi:hypothetical protein C8R26_103132 [Nitrosomonas oligotropha]|uniref:Uncharacterized protein n=2 Tax=Nitrosomonas oligotropha TaxID=42354 RepID=A0A2T5I3I2_9PROT|nr:hypothetical protein C8R26_103132 [Nitrosomonas oligotropha]
MLLSTNKDGLSEFMWACVGAGVGLIIPVLEKIKSAFIDDPATPLTIIGTFEICIFFVSVALVVLIAKISSTRSKKADELATEIRGRGRV